MKDQNSYNLNGLRAVFWGMLLEIVSNVGASSIVGLSTKFSGEVLHYIGIGFEALSVVAFLMVIVGLTRVGKYSDHFHKSRNYYLWSLLLVVIAIGLAVLAVWFVDKNQDSSRTMLGTVAMIVGAVVLVLLAGWLDILKIKRMMNGCSEIARQNDEKRYAARCSRTWVYYMLFAVTTVVLAVILAVVAIRSLLTTADTTGGQINSIEDMAGGFQYFFYVAGGLAASCVLLLISYLLVMGKVNGTLMRYHKVEIPLGVYEEEDAVPVPPMEASEAEMAEADTNQVPEVPVPPTAPAEPDAASATAPKASAEPDTTPVAEPMEPAEPAAAPLLKQGGKHAKPSMFAKQAPARHAAPKSQKPTTDLPAEGLPVRDKEAETRTIEMPKEPQNETVSEATDLFEE